MAESNAPRDGEVVAAALATAVGAWLARDVPLAVGMTCTALGLFRRRRLVLLVGLVVLASGLGARAWATLQPQPERSIEGRALLVSDPEPVAGGVRARLELDHRRYDAWARGEAARALRPRAAGELIEIAGRTEPLPKGSHHLRRRHVAERLQVDRTGRWWPGSVPAQAANGLRRLLMSGAASLDPAERALYAGFVLGDDRGQDPETADAFEATGLTHLLAVSGENVGFVLLLARPLLARLGLRWRMIATVVLLAFFALLTRFEPSVVRASTMAGISVLAMTAGLPVSGVRVLALAVIGVLLVDPLLVGVLGFQLSVLASLAIIVCAPALSERLPGPAWLRDPLAVTLAAQAGVAPVLISAFGGIPLASVPANLLAGPAAGPLMVHGLVGGAVAGVAAAVSADGIAAVIHLPTRALLWWVTVVARTGADAGFGELGGPAVLVLTAAVLLAVWSAGRGTSPTRRPLVGVITVVLIAGAIAPAALQPWRTPRLGPHERLELTTGAVLWTSATSRPAVLVLDGRVQVGRLLAAARRRRVRDVPVVIAATSSPALADAIAPVARRLDPTSVIVPPSAPLIEGSVVPVDGAEVRLDGFVARVRVSPERVDLEGDAD